MLSAEEKEKRRQEYQAKYYAAHRGTAKEYQRDYNLRFKKHRGPGAGGKNAIESHRPPTRTTYHHSDIMHAPVEKTLKMLTGILAGEKALVGAR